MTNYVELAESARSDPAHPDHRLAMSIAPHALATVRWIRDGGAWRCETCGIVLRNELTTLLRGTLIHYVDQKHWVISYLTNDVRSDRLPLWPELVLFAQAEGYSIEVEKGNGPQDVDLTLVEFEDLMIRAVDRKRKRLARQLQCVVNLATAVRAGEPMWMAARSWPANIEVPGVYRWSTQSAARSRKKTG